MKNGKASLADMISAPDQTKLDSNLAYKDKVPSHLYPPAAICNSKIESDD